MHAAGNADAMPQLPSGDSGSPRGRWRADAWFSAHMPELMPPDEAEALVDNIRATLAEIDRLRSLFEDWAIKLA